MKGSFGKIRISRKLVLIVGGVVVLCGGTGAAAVFIGTEALLGPSYRVLNGLECTEVKTVKIHKPDRLWIRKYVTTEPSDGLSRVRTALRVAAAVYATDKPDLVQVVVLDKKGPESRSDMRGRAIGADVIFIADPSRVPEESGGAVYTARYVDKPANENGQFYGEKIIIPIEEIEQIVAKLDDKTDCVKLELPAAEGHDATAPAGHGEAPAGDGHGAPAVDADGEAPAAEGHGTPAADAHGQVPAAVDTHGQPILQAPAAESGGWFASLKSMVLGAPEAPAAAVEGHDAAPAEDAGGGDHSEAPHDTAPAEDSAELPAGDKAAASDAASPADTEAEKSDEFGSAWLAKLRATPVDGAKADPAAGEAAPADTAAAHGNDVPAEDEGVLPPKSVLPKPDAHAAPTH